MRKRPEQKGHLSLLLGNKSTFVFQAKLKECHYYQINCVLTNQSSHLSFKCESLLIVWASNLIPPHGNKWWEIQIIQSLPLVQNFLQKQVFKKICRLVNKLIQYSLLLKGSSQSFLCVYKINLAKSQRLSFSEYGTNDILGFHEWGVYVWLRFAYFKILYPLLIKRKQFLFGETFRRTWRRSELITYFQLNFSLPFAE